MKTLLTMLNILLFGLLIYPNNTKNSLVKITINNDSTYYSSTDECNIILIFLENDSLIYINNNTSLSGKLIKIEDQENQLFEFHFEEKTVFILGFNEGYYILNQNYQIPNSAQKGIMFSKIGDPTNSELLNNYWTNYSDQSTVSKILNDKAYYLEQAKYYQESILILSKVIEITPSRTVAYINLGDAYWGLKEYDKAKQAYRTYIAQMKANGKEAKIPDRILERVQ